MLKIRLLSILIDQFFFSALAYAFASTNLLENDLWFWLIVILYVLKDSISRSLGKRIMGLWIVDKRTFQMAPLVKRVGRNFFIFIWPIELVFLLLRRERMGDVLFGTSVIERDPKISSLFERSGNEDA